MSEKSALDEMLEQYEKSNAPKFVKTETAKVFDENNYFTIYDLPKGVESKTKDIRILPNPKGGSPIVEFWAHSAVVEGKKRQFPCLKHLNGEACPFCEARELLLATGKESDKELAKNYRARKMYIVKLIDRENEAHGPKFWRFNDDYNKKGVYDMIMGTVTALKKNKDIMNPETGRDLSIMITRVREVPTVTSVVAQESEVISEDEAKKAEWIADTRTWENVFSVKNYDYLEIIVNGEVPVWDKDAKQFVRKGDAVKAELPEAETEISMGIENVKASIKVAEPTNVAEPEITEDEEDDMPF